MWKPLVNVAKQPKKQPIVSLKFPRLKSRTFSRPLLILQKVFLYKLYYYLKCKNVLQNHNILKKTTTCIGFFTYQIPLKHFSSNFFSLFLAGFYYCKSFPIQSSNLTLKSNFEIFFGAMCYY